MTVASTGVYSGKPGQPLAPGPSERDALPNHQPLLDAPLLRIPVDPSDSNGLLKPSQLMADKLFTKPKAAIGTVVGQLEISALAELDLALRSWLELN